MGLTVFGVMTLLLGCLAGVFVALMLFGLAASANSGAAPVPFSTMLPGIAMYGGLAVVLVWLGIGSIMARRWARALLLIFSWSWLGMGVFMTVFVACFMPKILAGATSSGTDGQPAMPQAALVGMIVGMVLVLGFFFVLLPAVWTFFYHSRHVKATCETRDPARSWTDACPLPVLGFCLWLLFSALMMLLLPVIAHGVMPFFGVFLTALPGTILCLTLAVIWGYAAWSLYRLKQHGWWLIVIAMCGFMVSAWMTFARHDIMEMYRLMGYPRTQIEQIQKTGLLDGNRMAWLTAFSVLPFLAYLAFIRKFLFRKS